MPIAAIVGGLLGVGSSLLGSASAASQARSQNRRQREAAQAQHKFDVAEWERANRVAELQWRWDMARIGQLREIEVQKAEDQANYASMLIKNATTNLLINQQALADRFVTEERLRGQQVGMEFDYNQSRLRSEYEYQATQLAMDQLEQSRQFMNQIDLLANESNSTLQRYEDEANDLMASLTLDEARDNLGYQLQMITAMEQDGRLSAVASTNQGGGATAQRLAMQSAQALGRAYAELDIKAKSREQKVAMINTTMRSGVNNEMARIALEMQDRVARGDYSTDRTTRDSAFLAANFDRDSRNQSDTLERLTLPTFDLGQRQYGRELQALQIQTEGRLYEASLPYRQAPYLDPLRPIPGLKPIYTEVGSVKGQSTFGMIGSALLNGFQSANNWQIAATGRGLFG